MAARPTSVRVAVGLMSLVGVGYLVDAAGLLAGAGAYPAQFRRGALDAGVDPRAVEFIGSLPSVMPYVSVAMMLGAAAFLLVVAQSVRAGHFAGRIVAWVGLSLGLLCSGCAGVSAGTPAFSGVAFLWVSSGDESGTYEFVQRLPEGYPQGYQYLSAAIAAFGVLALGTAIVLLALPSANRYFRPPAPPVQIPPYPVADGSPPVVPAPRPDTGMQDDRGQELADLRRRHQRGELSEEEYEVARRRVEEQR